MTVCDCFGLTEAKIRKAVIDKRLEDAYAVYQHFKAESCGACEAEIERIIEEAKASA